MSIRDPEDEAGGEDEAGDEENERPKTRKPWVVDRLQFKRDGIGYLTGSRRTHLYVFDVESKELTQITSGDYDDSQGAWSPDGSRVAFVSNRTANPDGNSNSDIWIVAADKRACVSQFPQRMAGLRIKACREGCLIGDW